MNAFSDFFSSVKADLSDRRLLPLVAFVCVCLVAAIAYAALGGSSSSAPTTASAPVTPTPTTSGLSVTSTTPNTSVAETTDGVSEQHGGKARNPFTPLAGASSSKSSNASMPASSGAGSSSSPATSSPASSSTSGTSGTSGASGGTSTKSTTPSTSGGGRTSESNKKTPAKTVYDVVVKFGPVPAGATPQTADLPRYESLKLQEPLPSSKEARLIFRGVGDKGKSATFTLVAEAILSGEGSCLPTATQCQAIDLKAGKSEQLSYLQPNGETLVYALEVVSIKPLKASASAADRRGWAESRAGAMLLRQAGLQTLPFLHYASQPGVLVFGWSKSLASRFAAAR